MVEPSICACQRLSVLEFLAHRAHRHICAPCSQPPVFLTITNRWISRKISPTKLFWFTADAAIADPSGINLSYGSAIEAAFSGGDPAEGDQISFARIRIRVDVPDAGTYLITHPYGVEVFTVDTPGRKAINMTRDIGIGAPKTYDMRSKGDIFAHFYVASTAPTPRKTR